MGCWNQTCGISHLPILSDDEVIVIPLVETNESRSIVACSYDDNYAPLCFPIVGKYDEYGCIEDAKVSENTMELLKSLKIVWEDDEPYEMKTIEEFIEDIEHYNIYLKTNSLINDKSRIKCVFYNKKLYDTLVEEFAKQKPYYQKEGDFTLSELYTEALETIAKNYSNDRYEDAYDLELAYMKVMKISSYGYSFLENFIRMFLKEKSDVSALRAFNEELLNYKLFVLAISTGRYGFGTLSGAGSQESCVLVQRIVAKFILEYTENNERYYTSNDIYWFQKD